MARRNTRTPTPTAEPRGPWREVALLSAGVVLAFGLGAASGSALESAPSAEHAQRGAARSEPSRARVAPLAVAPSAAPRAFEVEAAPASAVPAAEDAFAVQRSAAQAAVAAGPASVLRALREGDDEVLSWVVGELEENGSVACDPALIDGLRALAADPSLAEGRRVLALDLLGRSPATDADAVASLGEVARHDGDAGVRGVALDALCALARERDDLQAPLQRALLAGADGARDAAQRAQALSALRTRGAAVQALDAVARHLDDGDAAVRAAAARALADSDAGQRGRVLAALERSLEREPEGDVARAALAVALRVARGDADALLARLAAAPAVRNDADLQQQVADYRRLLGEGETDPVRILQARTALVHHRSLQQVHAE